MLYSSPTVSGGQVYVGSQNGTFYDLNEGTGAVVWSHFTGQQPQKTCSYVTGRGFVSSATVAPNPATGKATVYVAAPNGFLYAWNASNGRRVWRSVVAIPSRKERLLQLVITHGRQREDLRRGVVELRPPLGAGRREGLRRGVRPALGHLRHDTAQRCRRQHLEQRIGGERWL